MNIKKTITALSWFVPALIWVGLLGVLWVLGWLTGLTVPLWLRAGVFLLWLLTAVGYVIQLNLLKQIGGFTVVVVVGLILLGALLPKHTVGAYPRIASDHAVRDLNVAWNAVWGKNLFKDFDLKDQLLDYAKNIARFDIYQAGKRVAFLCLGLTLGFCFLFPLDPFAYRIYAWRFLLILLSGGLFGLQVELLQSLSPTREVTLTGVLDSGLGLVLGLLALAAVQMLYAARMQRRPHASNRFNVLGIGVDAVDMADCLARFKQVIDHGGRRVMTSALGVAGIMSAWREQRLQRILNESVLNMPDGMPLVWLGRLFGYRGIGRVYGPDLLREVCAYSADKGWKHFFYGSAPGVADLLQQKIQAQFPGVQVVGTYCPPYRPLNAQEEAALVEQVNRVRPDIFWIGISTPRQLFFMDAIKDKLDCKILCPVGYGFDVNAGIEKEAPDWIKYAGLQWLHRAFKDPRLWKRYLPDNPTFVMHCLLQLLRLRAYPLYLHEIPRACSKDGEGAVRYPAGVVSLSALTLPALRARLRDWLDRRQPHCALLCTAETVVQCSREPRLAQSVQEAGLALADSAPLAWLAQRWGWSGTPSVAGADLVRELCALSAERGLAHYFVGPTAEVLAGLKQQLRERCPGLKIAGMSASPQPPSAEAEKTDLAERINASRPDVVWCVWASPLACCWVAEFRARLQAPVLLAVEPACVLGGPRTGRLSWQRLRTQLWRVPWLVLRSAWQAHGSAGGKP